MSDSDSDNEGIGETSDAQKALVAFQSSKSKYTPSNGVELCSCFQEGVDDCGLLQIVQAREQEDRWALLVSPKTLEIDAFGLYKDGFDSALIMLHDVFTEEVLTPDGEPDGAEICAFRDCRGFD